AGAEQGLGLLGSAAQLLSRGQHAALLRERLVLAGLGVGLLQLVQLVAEEAGPLGPGALVRVEPRPFPLRFRQRGEGSLVLAARGWGRPARAPGRPAPGGARRPGCPPPPRSRR